MRKIKVAWAFQRWYLIPNELYDVFLKDVKDITHSKKLENKYRKYETGIGVNGIQLYAEIE